MFSRQWSNLGILSTLFYSKAPLKINMNVSVIKESICYANVTQSFLNFPQFIQNIVPKLLLNRQSRTDTTITGSEKCRQKSIKDTGKGQLEKKKACQIVFPLFTMIRAIIKLVPRSHLTSPSQIMSSLCLQHSQELTSFYTKIGTLLPTQLSNSGKLRHIIKYPF